VMHDPDLVSNGECFILVVRHQDGGSMLALEDIAYFQAQAFTQADIQVRKRLVQQ
jgi:hypothetical protein